VQAVARRRGRVLLDGPVVVAGEAQKV